MLTKFSYGHLLYIFLLIIIIFISSALGEGVEDSVKKYVIYVFIEVLNHLEWAFTGNFG